MGSVEGKMNYTLRNLVSMRKKFNRSFRSQKQRGMMSRTRSHCYKPYMLRALLSEGKTHCLVAVNSKVPPYLRHGWIETRLSGLSVCFSHGSPVYVKSMHEYPLDEMTAAIDVLVGRKVRLSGWGMDSSGYFYCIPLKTLKDQGAPLNG